MHSCFAKFSLTHNLFCLSLCPVPLLLHVCCNPGIACSQAVSRSPFLIARDLQTQAVSYSLFLSDLQRSCAVKKMEQETA